MLGERADEVRQLLPCACITSTAITIRRAVLLEMLTLTSPIHDHSGSNCWVKVLKGELEEVVYQLDEDGVTVKNAQSSKYSPDGVTYISDQLGVHRMGNATSSDVAVSLHVYSPPYHECHIFGEEVPEKKKVCITAAYGSEFPFIRSTVRLAFRRCISLCSLARP